jgi:hypothetical protein
MSDVGQVAAAVTVAGQIALEILRPDQRKLIADAERAAQRDCNDFARALLNRDAGACNLLLHGLQHTVAASLTATECERLRAVSPTVSGLDLLGLYQRARAADLAATVSAIVQASGGEK